MNSDEAATGERRGEMGIREAAKLIGRSVGMVRYYTKCADLPFRRGGEWPHAMTFDEGDVREWMSRPETRAMLRHGESIKDGFESSRARATA